MNWVDKVGLGFDVWEFIERLRTGSVLWIFKVTKGWIEVNSTE